MTEVFCSKQFRPLNLVWCMALGSLPIICIGCGGSSDSTQTASFVLRASATSIEETSDSSITLTVSTEDSIPTTAFVNLQFSGSAHRGVDYEISAGVVQVNSETQSGSVTFTPQRDWIIDPNETAIISLGPLTSSQKAGSPNSASIVLLDGPIPEDYKEEISADLRVYGDLEVDESRVTYRTTVYNTGARDASPTRLHFVLRESLRDSSSNVHTEVKSIPALTAGSSYSTSFSVQLSSRFRPNKSYYGFVSVERVSEEISERSGYGHDYLGFTLDSNRRVQTRCKLTTKRGTPGVIDPLFVEQWHLSNSGQSAFSGSGGTAGWDLGMDNTLGSGPNGEDVRVAVVDTGLEHCHPDILASVEPNESYNFAADLSFPLPAWSGAVANDAFNPYNLGDHGTSVAGIIASTLDNAIGGRGVAPMSELRGYNFLSYQSAGQAVALGSSNENPNSASVDVFNMSYGTLGYQGNLSNSLLRAFEYGTSQLRNGKGAIYVKAAGNGFNSCINVEHEIRSEIGCRPASVDPTNNSPYLIIVGGFNADGVRASYASAGSSIWISAPAGQYGSTSPAIITLDQQGTDRGYEVLNERGLNQNLSFNPEGNYTSTFNGTSSATPMVSGAVAVLLSENSDLTWRDVKHILATTARTIDPDRSSERVAFGDAPPLTLRNGWIENDAGYSFHNWYGFGAVNLDEAVAMARNYEPDSLGEFQISDWLTDDRVQTIPDFHSGGIQSDITVSNLPEDASIEAVVVNVDVIHQFPADLAIQLRSPAGTESVINPAFNDVLARYSYINWNLLSNAFYGESPTGVWEITIVDAAERDTGQLSEWSIRFYYGSH